MNFILIIGFIALMGSQTLWAISPISIHRDSIASTAISDKDLQSIPYADRNLGKFFELPTSPSESSSFLDNISKTQAGLKDNLNYFSAPSFQLPNNLNGQIKDYLSHAPQDTQQIVYKLDAIKFNPDKFYGKDDFAGLSGVRSWNIFPEELPKHPEFTPQEQIWEKKNIPFGRLGISEMNNQWTYGLSTYSKDNWQWDSGYKLGESFGINGPIVELGKSPQGPDLSFYSSNGIFIGDVTRTKLKYDPEVIRKYLLKADNPDFFGPSYPYDRTVPVSDFRPHAVVVLPYDPGLKEESREEVFLENLLDYKLAYSQDYWDEDEDCDDDEYYYYNYDECNDFYDYADDPYYSYEETYQRSVLDSANVKDPNDPLYPNPKPKKKSGGSIFGSILGSIIPIGNGGIGASTDDTSSGDVDIKDQYYLPQIGFTNKSDPNSAWNAVDTKGPNVIVAVIDTGLDMNHPDGPEFIWQNPADGSHGWNFLDENTDLKDLKGHGTMVAGIIAARTNNGIGMAGINPGAVIMPLKVADKNGNTNSLNIYRAIHFAVDHGARVINISLGARGVSTLEKLAINYARSHHVLVIIASGNSDDDISIFGPSSSGSAMAVGALNVDGSLATVSNWGANNSLMAPGEQIFSLQSKDAHWNGPAGQRQRLYTKESGTSFSAPMVAATASLLLVKNPNLTVDQLEDILMSSAKPLDQNRWNGKTGAGLLDAAKALRTDPQDTFNVKITRIKAMYVHKRLDYVDVYATVRGAVDYFTVEVGRGKYARSFRPVIGIAAQQASDDLVAHLSNDKLRGSSDWILLVRAVDKSGREYEAQTALTLK